VVLQIVYLNSTKILYHSEGAETVELSLFSDLTIVPHDLSAPIVVCLFIDKISGLSYTVPRSPRVNWAYKPFANSDESAGYESPLERSVC
jgi:hypothetical protein